MLRQAELIADGLERGDEEVVGRNGETDKHDEDEGDVDGEGGVGLEEAWAGAEAIVVAVRVEGLETLTTPAPRQQAPRHNTPSA